MSVCGAFYHRKVRNGTVKWVCSGHAADTTACDSRYYSEARIYDGIITMINKLRFCEEDILGQTIQKLEFAAAAYKRNNRAANQLSQSIAELNAKLLARKRAMLMHPQDAFNSACFSSLIDAVSLSAGGGVILHTKTQTEIYESEDKTDGSTENPEADSYPD